jgi:hypothetical protein
VFRLTADDGETQTLDEATITVTSPVGDWQAAEFGPNAGNPAIAGDLADPDFDGVENLLEYALVADPNSGDQPTIVSGRNPTTCTLTYSRPVNATDVAYVVEWSDNLTQWQSVGVTQTVISTVGNVQTVRAQVNAPPGTNQCFMHVKVTRL